MVGDGDLKADAVRLSDELKLNSLIIFESFRTDVPDVLNAMDVFCLPSLWEGLPIALLEAMAMEKAIVATAVDGTKEIIMNNQNGLIVPPQNSDALADAILFLLNNKELAAKLGEQARQTVATKFDVEQMTRQTEDIYLDVLKINRAEMKENMEYEYDRIADRKRVNFIEDVLKKSLPVNGKILDVGCGNGVISRHLGKAGFNVTGIDVSEKTIEMAKASTNKYCPM